MFSSPQGTEMFQFPWFPRSVLCVQTEVTPHDGCRVSPFGYPRIEAWSAAPRGFSQPPTSFIGFRRQGIHRWLFVAWRIIKMLVLALKFSRYRDDERRPVERGAWGRLAGSKRSQKTEQRDCPNVRDSASGLESLGLTAANCAAMTSDQRGSRWPEWPVS